LPYLESHSLHCQCIFRKYMALDQYKSQEACPYQVVTPGGWSQTDTQTDRESALLILIIYYDLLQSVNSKMYTCSVLPVTDISG
jgi:hypothetical protein